MDYYIKKIKEKTNADFVNWYYNDDFSLFIQTVHKKIEEYYDFVGSLPSYKQGRIEKNYIFKTRKDFLNFVNNL